MLEPEEEEREGSGAKAGAKAPNAKRAKRSMKIVVPRRRFFAIAATRRLEMPFFFGIIQS